MIRVCIFKILFFKKFSFFKIIFDTETATDDGMKQFLLKADQYSQWMVNMFVKFFLMPCTFNIIIECIASAIYSHFRYGFIDPNAVFRPYLMMYDISN